MRQSDLGEGPGDAGVGEQNEGQKKTFSIGFWEGKEKQRAEVLPALAAAGPVEGVKVIETKFLETTDQGWRWSR